MGSKWISIRDEYPRTKENVWVLIHTPKYEDVSAHCMRCDKYEVMIGYRFDSTPHAADPEYRWYLVSTATLDDGFETDDVTHWDWGETTEVIAWQPIDIPEPEVMK